MCGWVVALLGRGEARWTRSWPEGTFRWPLGRPKPKSDRRRPCAPAVVGGVLLLMGMFRAVSAAPSTSWWTCPWGRAGLAGAAVPAGEAGQQRNGWVVSGPARSARLGSGGGLDAGLGGGLRQLLAAPV